MSKQSLYETFSKQIKPVTTTLTTLNKPLQVVNKNVKPETRQPTFEDGLGINSNRQIQKQQDLKEQRLKQQKQFDQEQKEIQERLKQQQLLQKQSLQKQQNSQLQLQSRPQHSQQSSREQISAQQLRTQQPKSRPIEQPREVAQPPPQSQRTQQSQQQTQHPTLKMQQQPPSIQQPIQQNSQQRPQQQSQIGQPPARQQPQQQQIPQQQQQRPVIKEQQIQKQQPTAPPRQQIVAAPSEFADDERLYECQEGCGRSFNARALEKHSKVCQKVFQQKRKAFNSAEQRIVEEEIQVIKPVQQKKGAKREPEKKAPEVKHSAKPKWLAQSEAFRAVIKQAKGTELTKEETAQLKQTMEESQGLVQCKFCGRKFNAETAKKHVVFCETKSKQQVSKPKKK